MLIADRNVPQTLSAEITGEDGATLWATLQENCATADLWAQDSDRCNMSRVPMTSAKWRALSALAAEVADRMDG